MFATRIHGRGGQGVVTAAELLAAAAFAEGRHAQAFPSFGSERTGAPVVAYCRISDTAIRTREPIIVPDALIIGDATLLHQVDVFAGLPAAGFVLVNTAKSFIDLGLADFAESHQTDRLRTVPATQIALRVLGKPVPNAALLGGFAAMTGLVGLESVLDAIRQRFGGDMGDRNAEAAREAHDVVAAQQKLRAEAR